VNLEENCVFDTPIQPGYVFQRMRIAKTDVLRLWQAVASMTANIEAEINRAAGLGTQLEHLVYNKSKEGKLVAIGKDDDLLHGFFSFTAPTFQCLPSARETSSKMEGSCGSIAV
jgi:hypothetical protein